MRYLHFLIGHDGWKRGSVLFNDIGIPVNSGIKVKLTDAVTGNVMGIYQDCYQENLKPMYFRVVVGEIVK